MIRVSGQNFHPAELPASLTPIFCGADALQLLGKVDVGVRRAPAAHSMGIVRYCINCTQNLTAGYS